MNNTIQKVGAVLIALIIVVAVGAMCVVDYTTLDQVKNVCATPESDTSILVTWKKLSNTDGYYVYVGDSSGDYEKTQINDSDTVSFLAENLNQASSYSFYVVAYRDFLGVNYRGRDYQEVSACTLPAKQVITNCYSNDQGMINVSWTPDANAVGYQIKYSMTDGAAADETIVVVDGADTTSYTVASLVVGKNYAISVATRIEAEGKIVIGEYSEPINTLVSDKVQMSPVLNTEKPMVALTFDDGPSYNSVTNDILDVLETHKARATFFMVGTNANDNRANLTRKINLGCELGNHTSTHQRYGANVDEYDIADCSNVVYNACGQYPTAFRSTGGITNDMIRAVCTNMGMPLYFWSIDTLDWQLRDADKIYNNVLNNVKDGDIILMHDIYPETAQAVKRMVPDLIKQGYQLVTVSELVTAKTGSAPVPGQQYLDGDTIKNNT